MYWPVIGLYAAFFSELMVRLPLGATFTWSVGLAMDVALFLGFFLKGRLTNRGVEAQEGDRPTVT